MEKKAENFGNLYSKVFLKSVENSFFFFLTALGGVQKSNRSFHFSSCTSWSQRELGNDIGIQIIHCSKFIPTSKYVYFLHMCTHTFICVCVSVSICVYIYITYAVPLY